MRHGYFLPSQDRLFGDLPFASEARETFLALGLNPKFAGRYDGVSIYQHVDGPLTKRLVLQDFFSEDLKVHIKDLP